MNKIKAVIFDMNGVFINDHGALSTRIEKVFEIPAEEIHPYIKASLDQVRQPGSDSKIAWKPLLDKLNITYADFFKFWFDGESLNTDLLDFAQQLKSKGIKIIILSNNFPERTKNYRDLYPELFKVVDKQFFSWETGFVKPSKEAFLQVLNAYNFLPSEFVYFDDKEENLEAASALGITSHKFEGLADIEAFLGQYE